MSLHLHRDHIAEVLAATREGELEEGLLVQSPAVSLLERSRTIAALPTALPGSFGLPEQRRAARVSSKDTEVRVSLLPAAACTHAWLAQTRVSVNAVHVRRLMDACAVLLARNHAGRPVVGQEVLAATCMQGDTVAAALLHRRC